MNKTLVGAAIASAAFLIGGCTTTASTQGAGSPQQAAGMTPLTSEAKRDIANGYDDTLRRLYDSTPGSRDLVARAAGVLIFPRAISAGLIVGGEYGKGELRVGNRQSGYYSTITGSLGLQVGAQSRALVLLFMTQESLDKFRRSQGWSAGVDASVAVLKVGANGTIDVNATREPIVGFVMSNAGLMAALNFEGTKITPIQ